MKNFFRRIITFFSLLLPNAKDKAFLQEQIKKVYEMQAQLLKQLAQSERVYTSVQSFNSTAGDKLFWPWTRALIASDEYKYLIFSLRESVINELVQVSEPDKMRELNGQLKMLKVIDNYLTTGLAQYDAEQKNKVR